MLTYTLGEISLKWLLNTIVSVLIKASQLLVHSVHDFRSYTNFAQTSFFHTFLSISSGKSPTFLVTIWFKISRAQHQFSQPNFGSFVVVLDWFFMFEHRASSKIWINGFYSLSYQNLSLKSCCSNLFPKKVYQSVIKRKIIVLFGFFSFSLFFFYFFYHIEFFILCTELVAPLGTPTRFPILAVVNQCRWNNMGSHYF